MRGTARFTCGVTIRIPAFPRPTLDELRKDFPQVISIESDMSPTEEVVLRLATVLKSSEDVITSGAYSHLISPLRARGIVLGYSQAKWLVANQYKPELAPFAALRGKVYVDFSGLIVKESDLLHCVPCLIASDFTRWQLDLSPLDGYYFGPGGRIAVSSKQADN